MSKLTGGAYHPPGQSPHGNARGENAKPPPAPSGAPLRPFDGKPYLADADFTLYNGDALEVLRTLPDESVHMCATSPPFYGLRDYGTGTWEAPSLSERGVGVCPPSSSPRSESDWTQCDHLRPVSYKNSTLGASTGGRSEETHARSIGAQATPYDKTCGKCGATRIDRQIGLEETPEQWVQKLVEVFREVRRVLRRDGTLWLEVGDSYNGAHHGAPDFTKSGLHGAQTSAKYQDTLRQMKPGERQVKIPGLKPKDLIGAPWLLAFALRADGWYLRSDIVWSRPNPMPESVTDRPTKSHSYVFLLSKSARYFFDQEAVREALHTEPEMYLKKLGSARPGMGSSAEVGAGLKTGGFNSYVTSDGYVPAGRNVRSVWNIATQPYPEAHFATYPEELVRRCILAGTSERGCCPECEAPWVREVEDHTPRTWKEERGDLSVNQRQQQREQGQRGFTWGATSDIRTVGWHPSCECGALSERGRDISSRKLAEPVLPRSESVPCTVLDPFSGSGTTALVARKHGRKCIGIELSADYCELSARRLQQLSLLSEVGS